MDAPPVNILVVDDVPERLVSIEAILVELGQNIVTADSGREALRLLLQHEFAVILLDVNMPGMDGFETAALIRQRKRTEHVPIIFVTGFSDETHVSRGYSLGAVDYILTPVVPEVLRAKVSVFVDLFNKAELIKAQAHQQVELAREQAARAAAETANRRAAILSEGSRLLTRSLDYEDTLANVGRAVVPALCDALQLELQDDTGAAPTTITMGEERLVDVDPAVEGHLAAARQEALELGLVVERQEAAGEAPWSLALVAPLVARGKTLGTMTLLRANAEDAPDRVDAELVENLAARSAIALDNARLYSELRATERRKDEFLALLGHELRNPLAAVSGAVDLLPMLRPGDAHFGEVCDILQRQVSMMRRMVDDLLDVSRITSGRIELRKEIVSVERPLAQAIELARPMIDARRHRFEFTPPPAPLFVEADPMRLGQVLANLLINAAKYTEPGGRIWLTVNREEHDVVFRVRDTGIGLSPDLLPHVFDLFVQGNRSIDRNEGGLGIGLTLVHGLTRLHGGRVTAVSDGVGRGSVFTVRLPAAPAVGPLELTPTPGLPAPDVKRRVLVVEDQDPVARMMRSLLTALGHDVRIAGAGQEALELALEYRPDAVFLDIGLPGMDGYEVAKRMRSLMKNDTPLLIAVTGYGQPEDRERSHEAGIDHHVVKPLDVNVLSSLLAGADRQAMRRRHAPSTLHA